MSFPEVQTPELCLAAVQKNAWVFKFVKEQTPELSMIAVKKYGNNLKYVKEQTEELCLIAVQEWGLSLKYVKQHTSKIYLAAVQKDGRALKYIKYKTPEELTTLPLTPAEKKYYQNILTIYPELCMFAIQRHPSAFQYVNQDLYVYILSMSSNYPPKSFYGMSNGFKTPLPIERKSLNDLTLLAVKSFPKNIRWVKDQTSELCAIAIQQGGAAIRYVKEKTIEFYMLALNDVNNRWVYQYIIELLNDKKKRGSKLLKYYYDLSFIIVKKYPYLLEYVKTIPPSEDKSKTTYLDICEVAVKSGGDALQFVKEEWQTPEICLTAVSHAGMALNFVKEQTPEICLTAVSHIGMALQFVKEQTPEICLTAVTRSGLALEFVKEQTPEICIAAVKQNKKVIQLVHPDFLYLFQNTEFPIPSNPIPLTQIQDKLLHDGIVEPTNEGVGEQNQPTNEGVGEQNQAAKLGILDPLTFAPPEKEEVFAFFVKDNKYYPIASYTTLNTFVKKGYKDSSKDSVYSPFHTFLISVSDIVWVKM